MSYAISFDMDDEHKGSDNEDETADANPENLVFPTSARPVFRQMLLLAGAILALCFLTYSCGSEEVVAPPQSSNPLPF